MKIKTRPDDDSIVQMDDWLAELREDVDPAGPPVAGRLDPAAGTTAAGTGTVAGTGTAAGTGTVAGTGTGTAAAAAAPPPYRAPWPPVPAAPAPVPAPAAPAPVPAPPAPAPPAPVASAPARDAEAPAEVSVRAIIGDQLRMPIMWCEMGSCISWHADRASLGVADVRTRAIAAGWRVDAFGRLACPQCQQTDPDFRSTQPVVLWDRYTAMVRAARIAAADTGQIYPAAAYTAPVGRQAR